MKPKVFAFVVGCLLVGAFPCRAQLFTPESVKGAIAGGLLGGAIGHNHHRQTGEGIAIGPGVGLLAGAAIHHSRHHDGHYRDYGDRHHHRSHFSYGLGFYGHHYRPYFSSGFHYGAGYPYYHEPYWYPSYDYRPRAVYRSPVYVESAPVTVAAPSQPVQNVTIIHNYYGNSAAPMSGANKLFGR